MRKEVLDVFLHRVKTLPNREPIFASSLCSSLCLFIILVIATILAIRGAQFDLRHLIIPFVCAIGVATVLFARWKKLALEIKEQGNDVKKYRENHGQVVSYFVLFSMDEYHAIRFDIWW